MLSSLNTENQIKLWAQELGFLACGFAEAGPLKAEEATLNQWLDNDYHGNMQYMENHKEMRLDPTLLVPGAKTLISLAFNYYPIDKNEATESSPDFPQTWTTPNEINHNRWLRNMPGATTIIG